MAASDERWDVVGVGANSVDFVNLLPGYPQPSGAFAKMRIRDRRVLCGGQTATAMCTCASLGLRSKYVGVSGTDENGRDVAARVIFGARASLLAGVVAVLIAAGIGVPAGLLAGFAEGWIDVVLSRIVDAMLACPFLILAIALAAFLGPSLSNAMVAIGVTTTPIFVRLTRGQVMAVKVEDYVEAARAVGNPRWRIVLVHILPNILPALIVQATLSIAAAIIAEAALSYLGLGEQPPVPSWGSMLNSAQRFLANAPWMAVWPGVAIFLTVLSFNLVGDGLRDALDPRER